jgi:uncharacterized Tic20 family protein
MDWELVAWGLLAVVIIGPLIGWWGDKKHAKWEDKDQG